MVNHVYVPRNVKNPHVGNLLENYSVRTATSTSVFLEPVLYDLPHITLNKRESYAPNRIRIVSKTRTSKKGLGRVLLALHKDGFQREVRHGRN